MKHAHGTKKPQWVRTELVALWMATKAGLTGRFTNHSVRRTMCTQLLRAGVAPTLIAQLSGQKNISSLSHYTSASVAQQEGMARVLQGAAPQVALCGPVARPNTSHNTPAIPEPALSTPALPASTQSAPHTSPLLSSQTVQSSKSVANTSHSGQFSGAQFANCTIHFHAN